MKKNLNRSSNKIYMNEIDNGLRLESKHLSFSMLLLILPFFAETENKISSDQAAFIVWDQARFTTRDFGLVSGVPCLQLVTK